MSFYSNVEKIIKTQGEAGLDVVEHYSGLHMELLRQVKHDSYSTVHGRNAGGPEEFYKNIFGVIQGDDFLPNNNHYSGNFEQGFLFTREKDILVGDTLRIKTVDSKARTFRVDEVQGFGLTLEIFTFWKLTAIGD